jgi:hypothetical protein
MKKINLIGMIVLFASFAFSSIQAQEITGTWKGVLNVQGTELPLVFNVEEKDGELSATMDSPSQGATGLPMDTVTFENNQLTIIFKQAGIKYVGTPKEGKMEGTFYQGPMELPLTLERTEKNYSRKS